MISCLLLSAGFSARFGSPKALARLHGQTIIEHVLKELLQSNVDQIIVVLGAHMEQIKPLLLNHKKIKVVYNKDYNLGQTSSFKAGLREINNEVQGIMLLPIDYPLLRAKTIDLLIARFAEKKSSILVPVFNEKRGHPPIFAVSLKEELLALDDNKGINTVIHKHEDDLEDFSVWDAGVIKTFNTQQELESIRVQGII